MLNKFLSLVKSANRICITGHVGPDPDSVGACYSLKNFLRLLGKHAQVVSKTGIPRRYSEFVGSSNSFSSSMSRKCDLLICCDCADINRLDCDIVGSPIIVNIDHHVSNTLYGDLNIVDSTKSSCCEVIYWFLSRSKLKKDWLSKSAKLLTFGIMFDTNLFRNASVSSSTFQVMSDLSSKVSVGNIGSNLSLTTYSSVRDFCSSFLKLKIIRQFKVAVLFLGGEAQDTEWIPDFMRHIKNFEIVCVVKVKNDSLRCSLRSRHLDVNRLAKSFGGGGHKNASAFRFSGGKRALMHQLKARIQEFIEKGIYKSP
ncbi:MAG: DHH family phosphoesterase [Deltaproteobacteria bacterium]|nr:DHH family phosphoesterase [Deltaproteobacteria bacterium]